MFRSRKRGKGEPVAVPTIPDWKDLVDVASGRILLDDAPPIDVRGFDVLGQGPDEEGDVGRLEAEAFSYFDSAPKRPVPAAAGEQLPLPAPAPAPAGPVARGGLRLVSSAPEAEEEVEEEPVMAPERVSLFGSAPDLDDEDDDEDDDD